MEALGKDGIFIPVAPARERGLKLIIRLFCSMDCIVAPARERGLKSRIVLNRPHYGACRSREGAWIEM